MEHSDTMANVARLIEKLLGNKSSPREEESITSRLLGLAKSSKDARVLIGSHSRAMPLFLSILRNGTPVAKLNVTATISILSKEEDVRMKVFLGGCVPAILSHLKSDSDEVKKAAAEAIYEVSCGGFADNRIVIKIFVTEGVVPTLWEQLSLYTQDKEVEGYVAGALRNLCSEKDDFCRETIAAGGLDITLGLLSSENTTSQSNAASLLACLLPKIKGRIQKLLDFGVVKILLRLLCEYDLSVRASAADALQTLSSYSTEAVKRIVAAGGIHVLIGAVVAPRSKECTHGEYGLALQEHSARALSNICGGFPSLILYLAELARSPRFSTSIVVITGALAYCLMVFEDKSALKEEPFNVKWVEDILVMLLKTLENKPVQDCVLEALASFYGNNYLSRWINHAEAKKILIGLVKLAAAEVQKHLVVSLSSLCFAAAGLWVSLKRREGVQLLISFLGFPNEQYQQLSVQLLAIMVDEVDDSKRVIAVAGGIRLLVQLLEAGSQKSKEAAGCVLSNLCYHSLDICACVRNSGALPAFVCLLKSSGPKGQEVSAKALKKLVQPEDSATINELRAMLLGDFPVSKEHIIQILGYLVTMATHDYLVQTGAVANTALGSLVEVLHDSSEETRESAASMLIDIFNARQDICSSLATDEIVHPCMKLLASKKHSFKSNSARALSHNLSWHSRHRGSGKMLYVAEVEIKPLIKLAKTSFIHAAEAAVAALANLLSDSDVTAKALAEDVVSALARVLEEGSSEGKKNASRALQLLLKHNPVENVFKEKSQFRLVVLLLLESLKSLDLDDSSALDILGVVSFLSRTNQSTSVVYPLWSTIVEAPSSWEPLLCHLTEGSSLVQDKSIDILSRLCGDQPVGLADLLIARTKTVLCLANKILLSSNMQVRVGAAALLICVAKENRQQTIVLLDTSGCLKPLICALLDMMKQNSFCCSLEIELRTPKASTTSTGADELEISEPETILGGTVSLWLLSIISSFDEKSKQFIVEDGGMAALSEKLRSYISDRQAEVEDSEDAWISAMLLAILFQDANAVQTPATMRIIPLLALLLKSDQIIDKFFAAQAMASLVSNGNKALLLTIANSGAISGLISLIGCIDSDAPNLIALSQEFSLVRDPDRVVLVRLFEIDDVRIGLISRKTIPLLVDLLRLMPDRPNAPPIAVNLLIQIANGCDSNKLMIAESGALEALSKYLLLSLQESIEESIALLLTLLFSNVDVVRHKAAPNTLNQLIAILHLGSRNARQNAAQSLRYLFDVEYIRDSEMANHVIQPLVDMLDLTSDGEQEAALGALLKLTTGICTKGSLLDDVDGNFLERAYKILSSTSSMELKKTAAQLCFIMFNNSRIRSLPLATKCIHPLIMLMESQNDSAVESSVFAFEKLLDDEQQVEHALGYDLVGLLVGLISGCNYRLNEAIIKALIKLGKDRTPRKLDMVKAGVISNCLALLPSAPSSLNSMIVELFRILTNSGAIAKRADTTRIVEPLFRILYRPNLSMLEQHTALQALVNVLEKPQNMTSLDLNPSQVLEPLIPLLESPFQAIQLLSSELLSHLLAQNHFQQDENSRKAIVPLVRLTGIGILTLQQTAVKALEKISIIWSKELANTGLVFKLSRIIMQDNPKPPDSFQESAALILSNILQTDYYFDVPLAVLVKMLHSSNVTTVETALNALIARERFDSHSVELMVEAHAVDALLKLLTSHRCEEASGRLLEAVFNNASVREMSISKYAIAPLSKYLLDPETRSQSGRLLAALALGDISQHEELARSSESSSACRALISLLENQPTVQAQMVAICALQNFVINCRTNRRAVAEAGGILVIQKQLMSSELEVAVQTSLLISFLFSNHELQEYVSNELIRSLTAALERELLSAETVSEELLRTIHIIFSNFPKLQVSGATTYCISILARALKSGAEAAQESILDTLCLLKHSWPITPIDVAKSQEMAMSEAIPSLQMLMKTHKLSFHERADSLLSCLPGCLIVTIHRGSNFKQTASYANAYCQLTLGSYATRQTKAVRFSNSPEWKEEFTWAFDIPPKGQNLHIVCKGKSTFGKTTLGRSDIHIDKAINEGSYVGLFNLSNHSHREGPRALEVELNWSNRMFDLGSQRLVG